MLRQKHTQEFWHLFILACLLMFGFAFYQGTTVLYLISGFHIGTDKSYEVNGVFSALVYLAAILSGYLTQQYIKPRDGLLIGLFMYGVGAALTAVLNFNFFILGLTFFSIGYGFLYTNIFFILGKIYNIDDPRREGSFTLTYMGFNLGAIVGFSCGGAAIQYHLYSFIIALIGLVFILSGLFARYQLKNTAEFNVIVERKNNKNVFFIWLLTLLVLFWVLLKFSSEIQIYLSIVCFCFLLGIFWLAYKERLNNKLAAKKLFILGMLTQVAIVYWVVYKMQDNLLLNFFQNYVLRNLGDINIPAPSLLMINPITILAMSPFLSLFWFKTGNKYNDPRHKISAALALFGLGFIFLIIGVKIGLPVTLVYPVLFLIIMSLSELILGPGVISMVGQLAEEKYQFILLGAVQLSTSVASIFSGQAAVFFHNNVIFSSQRVQQGYLETFGILGTTLIISSVIALLIKRVHADVV